MEILWTKKEKNLAKEEVEKKDMIFIGILCDIAQLSMIIS